MENIPTIGFLSLSVASVIFGLLLDRVGPRVVAVSGLACSTCGYLLFAYAPSDNYLKWAMALMAGGGIGPYLANITFAVRTSCKFFAHGNL